MGKRKNKGRNRSQQTVGKTLPVTAEKNAEEKTNAENK